MDLVKSIAKQVSYTLNKQEQWNVPRKNSQFKDKPSAIVSMKKQSSFMHGSNNALSMRIFQPPMVASLKAQSKVKEVSIVKNKSPYLIGKMIKAHYGEMNTFNSPSYRPQAERGDQGLGLVSILPDSMAASTSGIKENPSSSSRQPVDLGVCNPPLGLGLSLLPLGKPAFPLIPPLDLVNSLMPLIIVSSAYYSSYSINELLLILQTIGLDPIWLKEMLGITGSGPSDINPLLYAVQMQETGIDASSPPPLPDIGNEDIDYQNSKKLLALIVGSVAVGALLLWIASNGGPPPEIQMVYA